MKVFFSNNKLLLSLLFAKPSRWSSRNLSLPSISSSFQNICPGSIFIFFSSGLLFVSFILIFKVPAGEWPVLFQQQWSQCPIKGKIPSLCKLAVHIQCPRQGTGRSCYLVCFLEPSHLLASCCFLRCDCPSCIYEPYSFTLGIKLILGSTLMHRVCITNVHQKSRKSL